MLLNFHTYNAADQIKSCVLIDKQPVVYDGLDAYVFFPRLGWQPNSILKRAVHG